MKFVRSVRRKHLGTEAERGDLASEKKGSARGGSKLPDTVRVLLRSRCEAQRARARAHRLDRRGAAQRGAHGRREPRPACAGPSGWRDSKRYFSEVYAASSGVRMKSGEKSDVQRSVVGDVVALCPSRAHCAARFSVSVRAGRGSRHGAPRAVRLHTRAPRHGARGLRYAPKPATNAIFKYFDMSEGGGVYHLRIDAATVNGYLL